MAAATKAAAFGALLRIVSISFPQYQDDWRPIVFVLAALSMLIGAIAALAQNDIKRTLAYSSIAHAGYILMGVYAATSRGREAALFYLRSRGIAEGEAQSLLVWAFASDMVGRIGPAPLRARAKNFVAARLPAGARLLEAVA